MKKSLFVFVLALLFFSLNISFSEFAHATEDYGWDPSRIQHGIPGPCTAPHWVGDGCDRVADNVDFDCMTPLGLCWEISSDENTMTWNVVSQSGNVEHNYYRVYPVSIK